MTEHRASAQRYLTALAPGDPGAREATVGLVGIPYDGAVTYRGGASEGPAGIRAASDSIESYCPRLRLDLADAPPVDLGDLAVSPQGSGEATVRDWGRQLDQRSGKLSLLALGGDHLVAYPFLERALARWPDLRIVHVDAHTDLRPDWEDEPFNHATVMRRVLDRMGPDARLYQWGIRSGLRTEFELVEADPRIESVEPSMDAGLALVRELGRTNAPVYVTLDVDGLDPADIPGTGTPEPGGLAFSTVESMLVALRDAGANLVGADLVELAPGLDPTGRSAVAGARLARTLLLLLRTCRG